MIRRRDILWGAGGATVATATALVTTAERHLPSELGMTRRRLDEATRREEARKQAQLILRAPAWTELDLNAFLGSLSADGLLNMKKALGMVDSETATPVQQSTQQDVTEIRKKLLWHSSNVVEYPFRHQDNIQYHELVKWVAQKAAVHDEITNSQTTFVVEHELCKKLFSGIWDKLNQSQRMELLGKIDADGSAADHAAMAALFGSAAMTALSATVYFSGFAFYSAMSVTISTAAAWFGLTLPIAAYTGASSLVAFLTGPVGWAIAATAAVVGVALSGRANVRETTGAVVQIHMLKVAALKAVQFAPEEIFSVVGRVFPANASKPA